MTVQPLVTVVIVNWNGGRYLRECLRSLAVQTEPRFRAVVVDNASTDGSQSLVAELGDGRFSLVQLDSNTGFAHASNRGAREFSETPWIALLNPDAFPEPAWLHHLLEAARQEPAFSMFGSHLIDAADGAMTDGTGDIYHVSGRALRRDHGKRVASSHRVQSEVFGPCAAAALYLRSAWEQAGGLDEEFFCYMEDVDLAFRLRLLAHRCLYVPAAVCRHVGSATTGRRSSFSSYYGQRNLVWTFVKNMPSALFWLLLPVHLAANVAAVVLLALRGQFGVALRAKRDALAAVPRVWRQRRQLQAQREISVATLWALMDKRLWPKT